MADYNKAFPSKYIASSDLNGRPVNMTIERMAFEAVGQNKDMRWVAYFTTAKKGLVCNKTNCKAIAAIAGSTDTDHWAGHQIQLYVAEVEFQGEPVQALRVRQPQRQRVVQAPPPDPEPTAPGFDGIGSDSEVPF